MNGAPTGAAGPQAWHSATSAADRRAFWWLMAAALLVLGAGIGLRDPWPSDEPRFALVAKQMVESGDWLFPRRGSELYSDKPPMLMWLQAAFYQLSGNLRVAFLLPSLLAGLATLALTWDLGRRLWSPRVGLLAAWAVLTALMFSFQFKRAQIDPLVTMLITLANWGLVRHLLRGPDWPAWWLGCFAAGLGVITKGVGVIALLMLLPYLALRRAGWTGVTPTRAAGWRWAGGALAFLAAIAIWLLPMVAAALSRGTPEYLEYMNDILFNQTARRYAGAVGGHAQPFWYFVPVLLLHFFPLSLAYVSGWREWRQAWRERDARPILLLGWCALVFVFFSLAGGKREVYVLPMLPMLALALGPTLLRIIDAPWLRRSALASAVLMGAAFAGVGLWAQQGHWTRMNTLMVERGLEARAGELWLIVIAIGAVFIASALAFRARRGVHALLAGLAGLWLLWGLWAQPLVNDAVSSADVMRRADQIAGPAGEIALVGWKEQNLLMSPRPLVDFGFRNPRAEQFAKAARWQAEAPARRWIFARQVAVEACVDRSKVSIVGHSNRLQWWMFRADAVQPGCLLQDGAADADDGSD